MTTPQDIEYVKKHVREVPDFPKKGIIFMDITTATKDAKAMNLMTEYLYHQFKDQKIDYIAGIESRGFIFGAALAYRMNKGFVPIRKPNKLPCKKITESYSLEYGKDSLEMHEDSFPKDSNILIIDDLLATGGSATAACNLVKKAGGKVAAVAFVIELDPLKGRQKLESQGIKVVSMLHYNTF